MDTSVTRRDLAALAAAFALVPSNGSAVSGASDAAKSPWSSVEATNIDIATRFCKAWETRDVENFLAFCADDIVYQMFDNAPLTKGKDAMRKQLTAFVGRMREIRWEVFRSHAIGPIVINDRVDYFIAAAGGKDMVVPIVGVFWIVEGKIKHWYDYTLPGDRVVSPPPAAG